jgi:hypothetical protein
MSRNAEFQYSTSRLNYDPGEFTTDAPPEYVHSLMKAAREKDSHALYGVGADMGKLATFGRVHGFNEQGKASTYTYSPTSTLILPGTNRRGIPQDATHGFQSWPSVDLDPRELSGTQHGLQLGALEHYLSPSYQESGEIHDKTQGPGNDHPVVVGFMRNKYLMTGHHRAAAALLTGQPLSARYREIS